MLLTTNYIVKIILSILLIYIIIIFLFLMNFNSFILEKYTFKDYSGSSSIIKLNNNNLEYIEVIKKKSKDIILYFPDNNEDIFRTRDLLKNNINNSNLIIFNYRGFGNSEGQPNEMLLKEDSFEIFNYVKNKYPNSKINIIGNGLGSSIALNLSKEKEFNKLILISPFDNYSNVLQKKYPLIPILLFNNDIFNNLDNLNKINEKTYIFKFIDNSNIPNKNTLNLIMKLKNNNTEVHNMYLNSNLIYFEKDFFVKLEKILE